MGRETSAPSESPVVSVSIQRREPRTTNRKPRSARRVKSRRLVRNAARADTLRPHMTAMVYLPGAGGTSAFWRPVADKLRDLGRAVCLGWPGFGDEPADSTIRSLPDLADWTVARMPPGQCDLVAQSMGGVVAALIALDHAQRVRRLVLCATSGGVDVSALGARDWRPEYRAEFPQVPDWFVVDRTDLTARLSAIVAPTLVVYGDQDPLCPKGVAQFLAGRIPDAALACVAGGDHLAASHRASEVAALIRMHLAGDPGPGRLSD